MNTYVPARGNIRAKIALVGEAPSFEEERLLEPFVGPSGHLLNEQLSKVGINRRDCWLTNISKFMVMPQAKTGKKIPFRIRAQQAGVNVTEQIDELRQEINQIKPNIIIALGGTALSELSGKKLPITSWRGSIIHAFGRKCLPTYHPAHILHQDEEVKGYWTKFVQEFDLKRAKRESLFPEIVRPQRHLYVAKSFYEVKSFFDRYHNASNPAIDIEAHKCIPICIGISYSPNEGITIPLWNHSGYSVLTDSDMVRVWILLANCLANSDVVGQNFGYDRDKLRRLGFSVRSLHSDTMFKAFCINPELPKNLAFNTSIYTEEPYYKDEGMYEGELQDLYIGCARDACVTKEVDIAQQKDIDELQLDNYYRKFLLPLHDIYHFREDNTAIEQIGFKVDEEKRKELLEKYIEWDEKIRYELFQYTGEYLNTSSPKQVSELLQRLHYPSRKGTGEEVLTGLYNQIKDPVKKRILELILEDRRVKKTIDSYLMSPADFDGRMRTSYFLCLETGRSSTSKQAPPIRPLLETKKDNKSKSYERGMAFQTITKHGDIGADIRSMLVSDENYVFLQADSAQAEARVIFLLAEDYEALKDIDTHDYHALTASWFFGGTEDTHSKAANNGKETPIRFAGKTLRHAGHLGASKKRAALEVNTQARKYKIPLTITEAKAQEALEIFHRKQPKIRGVFHEGVIKCLEKDRRLIAPMPYGIEGDRGGTRIFFERWGDELFRQAFSYLPQRIVSENTKAAACRIRRRARWIIICCESHDALACRVPENRKDEAALILKEEFERPIDFSNCSLSRGKLVIPCEVEIGYNYQDLSKFKFMTVTA